MFRVIYLLSMFFFLNACNSSGSNKYEEAKENIMEKEEENPLEFLSVRHTGKRNLFGQTVVRGVIKSSATIATYKNVRIKMLYYDETGKLVTNHEEVIEQEIGPNTEAKFKAKYFTPKGTDSVVLSIMKAIPVKNKKTEK